ncbi:MAG: valine--tRNA ligase [Candidatus Ancillula sp.]|jgi:valyl-tRNA synthetase|nr:valine--tRNA ligase [Candidatus Ancillula sp.]
MKEIPTKASVDGIEDPLIKSWDDLSLYNFKRDTSQKVYSIDTPPPTVSGSLHVGHVFSYTHTDIIARYKRMCGYNVFYPMGFDDNGLPTERRVQNYYGVRPDISTPYDPNFTPPFEGTDKSLKASDQVPVSRQNFIELCQKLSTQDEIKFKELWQRLGISVDWNQTYQTIDARSRRVAQKAFLRNLERGQAYQMESPVLWDITYQTAVAQAELEAREYPGAYHKLVFHAADNASGEHGGDIMIETTRPELLVACVALIAHPDDTRYQHLFGKTATSPLFDVPVPILAHKAAQMDKGAGIAMCCTFGDQTDIEWWRDLNLEMRSVMSKNGRIITDNVSWVESQRGLNLLQEINTKTAFSAREIIVSALRESGEMIGEPEATTRMTNYFEKGDKPLEIVTSRQWYITNGGKDASLNTELIERGNELEFYPEFMRARYKNWVEGLNSDWLISRQRFFGVAFPLWYKVLKSGEVDYSEIITPDESALPVDPTTDVPPGFEASDRGVPGGFVAETDVMDTWATSSLTPQIACGWEEPEDGEKANLNDFSKLYPMSLRPQGQDIIRTWLFSTVVRAHLESDSLPWKRAGISGWILDPDRKKMSKSKGNVITPMPLLEQYGSDAVRYWASSAKLGVDATFDEGQMKIGRRLSMKVLNVSKFVLSMQDDLCGDFKENFNNSAVICPLDIALLAKLNETSMRATDYFERYDHAGALEVVEAFFWEFCDDYVELVKRRAYNREDENGVQTYSTTESDSAKVALTLALKQILKLLAPFIPFATDEAYSWFNDSSVHISKWRGEYRLDGDADYADLVTTWEAATLALEALRRVKSEAKMAMNAPLMYAKLQVPASASTRIKSIQEDLKATLNITGDLGIECTEDDSMSDLYSVKDVTWEESL